MLNDIRPDQPIRVHHLLMQGVGYFKNDLNFKDKDCRFWNKRHGILKTSYLIQII